MVRGGFIEVLTDQLMLEFMEGLTPEGVRYSPW